MTDITTVLPLIEDVEALPEPAPFYHLVGRDGPYIHKQTLFGRVIVPVKEITHLPKTAGHLWSDIPKIPADTIAQVLSFFRAIYERQHSEAMVYLTYKDGEYRVFVPPQTASGGGVKATLDLAHIADGWAIAGSIHSHCNFSAFHSGTDTHDADGHDGIHMTIGNIASDTPSFATMLSFNKVRWDIDFTDATDHDGKTSTAHPEWWERYVEKPQPFQHRQFTGVRTLPAGDGIEWPKHKTTWRGFESLRPDYSTPFLDQALKTAWDKGTLETSHLEELESHEDIAMYLESLIEEFDIVLSQISDLGLVVDTDISIPGLKTTPDARHDIDTAFYASLWSD